MSYKSVVIMSGGEEASNGLTFRTAPEAEAYGSELLSRWFAPVGHKAVESDEPVSHRWNFERNKCEEEPNNIGA